MLKQQFLYTSGAIPLAAAVGAVGNGTIAIAADYNYELDYITIMVSQAGLIVLNWSGTIQISWTGTGESISNAAIPVDAFAGNGGLPYILPEPRELKANTSATIVCGNPVATATVVTVVFHGSKLLQEY
jgi:hypothetical protein